MTTLRPLEGRRLARRRDTSCQTSVSGKMISGSWRTRGGGTIWLTDDGVVTNDSLVFRFDGASSPICIPQSNLVTVSNFYHGNDSTKWRIGVPSYAGATFHELYPGIDANYYFNTTGQLEVDFVVLPGADADCIEFAVPDDRKVAVDAAGGVRIGIGSSEFTLHKPVGLVRNGASPDTVECQYVLTSGNRIQFGVDRFLDIGDTLVIDPVLTFSTYMGGISTDYLHGVAVDSSGAIYVCGRSSSHDYPVAYWIP